MITLQPLVEFYGHRGEELSLVNSIAQMVTVGAAPGVPRWPDLNGRHELADGVYNLLGNALGLFRAGPGLFEAGVQRLSRLSSCGGRLASRAGRGCGASALHF